MVKVTESNMMEKEVNNWPAVENMFIVKDMVEEFCILNDAWLFCHLFFFSLNFFRFRLVSENDSSYVLGQVSLEI